MTILGQRIIGGADAWANQGLGKLFVYDAISVVSSLGVRPLSVTAVFCIAPDSVVSGSACDGGLVLIRSGERRVRNGS